MIQRAFAFFSTEIRGLHAAAYILAASSFFSSVLALLRDRILAHTFGAGPELDIYYAAFRIPDFVFIGAGALVSAYMLIPELSRRSAQDQKRYLDSIAAGFSLLVVVVASAAAVAAPTILTYLFPGLVADGHLSLLTLLSRILLLQAIFLGFSNIAAAITQFKHRYALYAFSPIVYNLGIICGVLVLYPTWGLAGLAVGVVIGAFFHLGIQLPAIWRDGFFVHVPKLHSMWDFILTVRISLPRALALSMNQLAILGLVALAGGLAAGSIAIFTFAYNLFSVPLAIIGASYATAAFPTLAAAFSRGQSSQFLEQVSIAARQILFWSLPLIALAIVLRAHIVRAVLGSGAFDWTDTRLTAAAFALFVVSLAAQGVQYLLIRAFYAAGRTFAPFIMSAAGAAFTVGLSVVFLDILTHKETTTVIEALLRVQDLVGTNVLALALAYSTSTIISTLVLALYFELCFGSFFAQVSRTLWQGIVAAITAGVATYSTLNIIGDITFASTLGSIVFKAGVAGSIGIAAAAIVYLVLRNQEFAENVQALRRRIWRGAETVASAE